MTRRRLDVGSFAWALMLSIGMLGSFASVSAAAPDIVLYASDITTLQGNWTKTAGSGAAGSQYLASADYGWSVADAPLTSPTHYVQATFTANANTPYRVWLRLRGTANSKYNESAWVQFNDATDLNGAAVYRLGTVSGLLVNLENCSGCGVSGWGWQDKAYWLKQPSTIKFAATGVHTIRIQTREDGVQFDQIVISPSTYLTSSPGQFTNDSTVVPKPATVTSPPSATSTPYTGTAVAIPARIAAGNFDNGGEGVAYHDITAGNTGTAYRSTDVDLESSADGGYDIGWIAAGEWVNYSVNVTAAGSYSAQLRVASPGGGSLHLGFNSPSNVWVVVSVPATGGWQNWTTVNVPVTLGAGPQLMTLLFDTAGFNVASINVAGASSAVPSAALPAVPTTAIANGAVSMTVTPTLSWVSAGATSYDLRLSTANPPSAYVSNITAYYYSPAALSLGTKYYWQVVAKNAAGSTTGPVWSFTTEGGYTAPPPAPPSSTSWVDTVAVDWNIQVSDASVAHAQRVIDTLMALSPRPQIIVMEEAYQNLYSTYVNQLAVRTGQTWQGVFQTHCPTGGWNGSWCTKSETEGVAIFTSYPIVNSSVLHLPYADCYHSARAAARLAVSVGGITVQVFGTHLQTGNCTNPVTTRAASMSLLKSWASNFSRPQILAGDLNATPDEINTLQGMNPNFVDTWQLVGSGFSATAFAPNPSMKIDYWLTDAGLKAQPLWTQVVTTTGTISDHLPLLTAFRIFK
jgi:endonuclease/exonuclease/phosphatase family metal-dependent hydrolase